MRTLARIEQRLLEMQAAPPAPAAAAGELLGLAEDVLCHWIVAQGQTPTENTTEGFRLLALHRQGAKGDPSFNACRDSCRELVYQHNLITMRADAPEGPGWTRMAIAVAYHLCLFISGKLDDPEVGSFCCSSRPVRTAAASGDSREG